MSRFGSILVASALALVGCDPSSPGNKATAEANGLSALAEARQFAELFPGSTHFITHYTGSAGPSIWNSKVGLSGRYVLSMSFQISFDPSRKTPVRAGQPEFHLRKVTGIQLNPDGTVGGVSYSGVQLTFGPDEWQRLIQARGDFSVIGIEINSDQPLEHFDEAWRSAMTLAVDALPPHVGSRIETFKGRVTKMVPLGNGLV